MVPVRVKPVHIVGSAWHVFPRADFKLEVTTDADSSRARVETLHQDLQERLGGELLFLDPALIREPADFAALRESLGEADALLVNISGGMMLHQMGGDAADFWSWDIPIIAYSGERTPMMGLYSLPFAERKSRPGISYALDADAVAARIRLISVKKRLASSKVLIFGEYACAEHLPDPAQVKKKLGVEFVSIAGPQLLAEVEMVEDGAAEELARGWSQGATGDAESSAAEVLDGARIYLAMERLLQREDAQAASVGCLELMYAHGYTPFCFALAALRDVGLPAGCEADAGATLTMLIFEYLAERPAYMGNLVRAEPETGLVSISHGCSPARVAGRDRPAKAYRLVHSHSVPPFSRDLSGGAGVTSYVDYGDVGQAVTVARLDADLGAMMAARGEIVECRDTICDRTTLTVRVRDARDFVHKAAGNHQVVVYGDYLDPLRELCELLRMELREA
ncbi:MAG: hypothetical protein JRG96_19665 [Deltaproteobacteria bacterium]|nr:hypothetical protein [Deltaproteobacteria bacterium]